MNGEDPVIARLRALKPRFREMNLKRVRVFGSRLHGDARPDSDLDLLVEFYNEPDLFDLVGLKSDLEGKLGCEVDLVMPSALHPALREDILRDARDV